MITVHNRTCSSASHVEIRMQECKLQSGSLIVNPQGPGYYVHNKRISYLFGFSYYEFECMKFIINEVLFSKFFYWELKDYPRTTVETTFIRNIIICLLFSRK